MRGTDTLERVGQRIADMAERNHDEMIPVVDMEFNSLDNMYVAGKQVEILPSAQRLFANRLRVPYSYISRCPVDLQAENLNHWLKQEAQERDTLFCRFNNGSRLRAVFTERYTALDNLDIVYTMLEHGFDPGREIHYCLDDELMVLKVPDPAKAFDVGGNDKVIPGIGLSNSEVGVLAFSIEAYFYRLACTNGLIAKTAVSSKFRHISRKGLEEFPDIIRQVVYESERSQSQFRLSLESPVDDPLSSITTFNRQFQVGKTPAEAVERGYFMEPGYSMFHVVNAYTRGAQEQGLAVSDSFLLERVGGLILAMVKH